MADKGINELADGVGRLGISDPLVVVGRGIARVGRAGEDAYRYAKDKIWPDRPAERPAAKRGDIRLPPERKSSDRKQGR